MHASVHQFLHDFSLYPPRPSLIVLCLCTSPTHAFLDCHPDIQAMGTHIFEHQIRLLCRGA